MEAGAAAAAVEVAGDETHIMIVAMTDMTDMMSMTTDTGNMNIHTAFAKSNLFLMALQVQLNHQHMRKIFIYF